MRRNLCLGLFLVTTSLGTIGACSSSSSPNQATSGDAGEDVTGGDVVSPGDSSAQDGPSESGADTNSDGSPPHSDAGSDGPNIPPPSGTRLANAGNPILLGVTSDGYAVYRDNFSTVYVVDTSGQDAGAPILISTSQADAGMYFYAAVVGPVVFSWPNFDTGLYATHPSGPMVVWSAATGLHQIPGMTLAGFAAASGDGSKIIYAATTSSAATSGDITVAGTDGSNPTVLDSQVAVGAQCPPQASFVGANQTDPLVAYCLPTDAATASAKLDAFTGASWTKTNLATALRPSNANLITPFINSSTVQGSFYVVDSSSTNILTLSSANEAIAISYPGATSSNLESAAATAAFFVGTGAAAQAVYATQAGAVHASTFPAGTPSTLVSSGANFVFSETSPDGKWGVYGTTSGMVGGMMTSDLTLFATSLPATTKTVTATADALFEGLGPSSFFTGDSTRLLWCDGIAAVSTGNTYGTLHAYDLASGSSTVVADKVWQNYSIGSATTVVYNDNPTGVSAGGTGIIADIKVVDVAASPLAPKLLQAGVDANFMIAPDQKTVIYAYTQGSGSNAGLNGIYAVPVP